MKLSIYFDGQVQPGLVVKGKFLGLLDDPRFGTLMRHPHLMSKAINETPLDGIDGRNALVVKDVSGKRLALLCQPGDPHAGNVLISDRMDFVLRIAPNMKSVEVTCSDTYMVVDL